MKKRAGIFAVPALTWTLPLVMGLGACVMPQPTQHAPPPPQPVETGPSAAETAAEAQKNQEVGLEAIRGMLEKHQYYAALAYIEDRKRAGERGDGMLLLEADARRHLAQPAQAEALYRKLLGTAVAGQAYHGLGLLNADSDLAAAIQNLQLASQRMPTDVEVRSDLGFLLMEAGRYTEAMPELSTAAELAPAQVKYRNNLILLMLLSGNEGAVTRLVQQSGTTPETLAQLRGQAQQIRNMQNARVARTAG